jgi:hypothetical protein
MLAHPHAGDGSGELRRVQMVNGDTGVSGDGGGEFSVGGSRITVQDMVGTVRAGKDGNQS